jgi:hypothetical protein
MPDRRELPAMTFNFVPSDSPPNAGDGESLGKSSLEARLGERLVTIVAVTLAVLFVTTVAVLMGLD